ncbi:MAG: hypothetical protein WBA16_10530 [Nonlabens sp.]
MDNELKLTLCSGKLLIYSTILFLFSFSSAQNKDIDVPRKDFVQTYKEGVFMGCLDKAHKGKFSKFLWENNDLSTAPTLAVLQHSELSRAEALGAKFSETIKPYEYADYEGRSPWFTSCLRYAFQSHQVDSIANREYNIKYNSKH